MFMRSRVIAGVATLATVAAFAACGSDSTTTVDTTPAVTYISTLSAANERPSVNSSTATGTATYTLKGNLLSFLVTVNGLTGPATASHIHVGAASVAGGVIVPFVTGSVQSGNVTSGTIDLSMPVSNGTTAITGDSLKVLLNNGNAYTNVHTSANGGGEIRGQIIKQ
jgi:phage-related minor tail protein